MAAWPVWCRRSRRAATPPPPTERGYVSSVLLPVCSPTGARERPAREAPFRESAVRNRRRATWLIPGYLGASQLRDSSGFPPDSLPGGPVDGSRPGPAGILRGMAITSEQACERLVADLSGHGVQAGPKVCKAPPKVGTQAVGC